jgi:16S rRNA (guanine1207-N2)-methyltransferase
MTRDALKTLFHPYANGTLASPAEGEHVLFLGAEAGAILPEDFLGSIHHVQGFRPLFRALQASHAEPTPILEERPYDSALILCGKHRGENEARLIAALRHVDAGGLILVAGAKEDGVQSLQKRLMQMNIPCDHMPKYHGVVFWFQRPVDIDPIIAKLVKPIDRIEGRFATAAGQFSHEKVDEASELLASRLPSDFRGAAADFGAAWGYLSVALAEKAPGLKNIDLFEADFEALENAKINMENNCPDIQARFFWHDLAAEDVRDKYDLVIMNPPFHEGHAADPSIGQAFIRRAASALKIGGQLMLVANRGLPYEPVLAECFKFTGETCRNARFKVLWGKK